MEKHKCKLCFKSFMSGKALGGHMSRSHYTNLPLPPKTPQKQETHSTELSSSELSLKGKEIEAKSMVYGLREHPKRSFRWVDAEFLDGGSVVQGKETETEPESTRKPTRKRSKRARKDEQLVKPDSNESLNELETASTVSDAATSDEDVALCLIMMSKDVWNLKDSVELNLSQSTELKHQCDMCNKVFKSSQALGGHRISHRKKFESNAKKSRCVKKVHECPFCGKVFATGQALGGHKRAHLLSVSPTASSSSKIGDGLMEESSAKNQHCLIDLNLPAPEEDDDQHEVYVVSNA